MKAIKFLMMAAAATVFAACSNDTEVVNDGPVAAQVNAEIYNIVGTRASGTTWAADDEIGISVTSTGLTTGTNVKYTYDSKNGFTSSSPIYFQDLQEVTFNAYYPFNETGETISKTITATDQTAAEQPKIDYMFARGATASKNAPAVNFKTSGDEAGTSFQHCMSQLTFEFKAGTGIDNLSQLTQYTIKSLNMAGTFDTETGVAEANTTAPEIKDLVFSLSGIQENPYTAESVIIFPQGTTNNTFDIEITFAGQTYKATLALPATTDNKFKAGYNLKYTVTINKTGLTIGDAEIFGWKTVQGNNGFAEM